MGCPGTEAIRNLRNIARCAVIAGGALSSIGTDCDPSVGGYVPIIREDAKDHFHEFLCDPFKVRCRCQAARWPSSNVATCDNFAMELAGGWQARADAIDLEYDPHCLQRRISAISASAENELQCGGDGRPPRLLTCEQECQVFFGERELGESCDPIGRRISTC